MKGFYFITDAELSLKGVVSDVKSAVAGGAAIVQYRNKNGSTRQMIEEAGQLRGLCGDTVFLINDRVDVCVACGADGVHLGQDDMPLKTARALLNNAMIIGVTVHSLKEALDAQRQGADYLGVSPIYATGTKKDAGLPAGIALIREIKGRVKIPVVAIGGINLVNAPAVIGAGADCLCAISAVVTAENVKAEITKFRNLWKKEKLSGG